jgi:hypothetical protein
MIKKIKEWLDKGEGGEFYEFYVTNRDLVSMMAVSLIFSLIIITGFWIASR